MIEDSPAVPRPAPRHLWVVGIIGLLWNAVGAYDYLMTETRNAAYMGAFSQAQLDYVYGFPAWVVATWAIAVWGGVLGCLLLLLRRRAAVGVLLASFLAMVLTTIHNYVLSSGLEVMGSGGQLSFTALIFVVAVLLWLYARAMARRGLLR
jgi:hypothetical protein